MLKNKKKERDCKWGVNLTSAFQIPMRNIISVLILSNILGVVLSSTRSTICPVVLPQDPPSAPDLLPASNFNRNSSQRIINGDLASENLQRYLASILTSSGGMGSLCSGTVVSKKWIVTAAHCLPNIDSVVSIGTSRSVGFEQQNMYNVDKVVIHPKYDETNGREYDIAILRLEGEIPDGAKPMKINSKRSVPDVHSFVRAIGYGVTLNDYEAEPFEVQGYLRQVDKPVSNFSKCLNAYRNIDYEKQVCAGYELGKCDSW